jgi:hypothetical protein
MTVSRSLIIGLVAFSATSLILAALAVQLIV